MRGTPKKLLATGLLACGLFACSGPELADLPVRTAPQSQIPHSFAADGAPLRGNAVAIELAPQQ